MAFDTLEQRLGMLGFGAGEMFGESGAGFDNLEAQILLGLPGQNAQDELELPDGGVSRSALGLGLGIGL